MPEPKEDRVSKTYQNESGGWVTEDYGQPREATTEEIEETLQEWEEAQKTEDEG